MNHDIIHMREALELARDAANSEEVPIGALIYDPSSKTVISQARNSPISLNDPCAHAEILALRAAGAALGNYRLGGLWLYVTLEPCAMCAGAISHARIARLVYGADDPKGGAVAHGPKFFGQPTCHHRPEVTSGVLAEESADLLKGFFKARRKRSADI
jgi:tRNA(adenine34) deaminase